jgi:ERCC4-type nuclease
MTVLIDSREMKSIQNEGIKRFGTANCKVLALVTGDTIVDEICFERKTWEDLVSSKQSGHLDDQLKRMMAYENSILIVEGNLEALKKKYPQRFAMINDNWIRGIIYSTWFNYHIPVYFEDNNKGYWKSIEKAIYKQEQSKTRQLSRVYKPKLSKRASLNTALSMLCYVDRISEKTATAIIDHFNLWDNIFPLYYITEEELVEVKGVGRATAKRIKSEFHIPIVEHETQIEPETVK